MILNSTRGCTCLVLYDILYSAAEFRIVTNNRNQFDVQTCIARKHFCRPARACDVTSAELVVGAENLMSCCVWPKQFFAHNSPAKHFYYTSWKVIRNQRSKIHRPKLFSYPEEISKIFLKFESDLVGADFWSPGDPSHSSGCLRFDRLRVKLQWVLGKIDNGVITAPIALYL